MLGSTPIIVLPSLFLIPMMRRLSAVSGISLSYHCRSVRAALPVALLLALGRYSVPILPALIVLSAFGVDTLLNRRAAARA